MRFLQTLAFLFFLLGSVQAQKHRVYFTNKGESAFLLGTPEKFLSQQSLERRKRQGIEIDEIDLPVSQIYKEHLKQLGLQIEFSSKWLNYALVDGVLPNNILELDFIKKIETVEKTKVRFAERSSSFDYGYGDGQIKMHNGDLLHLQGFTGTGVTIAVLDGGFTGTDVISAFDSIRLNNQILGTYNFVSSDTNVYTGGNHGTNVLSAMAANVPQQLVGSAPHANYWLFQTENEASESPVEMDNWLKAAEFSDSVGVDVINSSLGYSTFDDPNDNYTYADLNGNKTIVTKAADIAASKGIVVVVSAGNEGGSSWYYITAPADGDSVLAVGAVDLNGQYQNFSSKGPAFDGRIKPDVVAQGYATVIYSSTDRLITGNGTSFSSPIIAGLAACLVQAKPNLHAYDVLRLIKKSADNFDTPNNQIGYGIPDFDKAMTVSLEEFDFSKVDITIYPQPFTDFINFEFEGLEANGNVGLKIYDLSSRCVYSWQGLLEDDKFSITPNLREGVYLIEIQHGGMVWTKKIIR